MGQDPLAQNGCVSCGPGRGGGDSRMSPRDDPTLSGQGSVCEPVACSLKRLTKVSLRQQNRGGVTSQH